MKTKDINSKKYTFIIISVFIISLFASYVNAGEYLDFDELLKARQEAEKHESEFEILHGLHVDANGELVLGGEKYKGHGVNWFSLFNELLINPDADYKEGLTTLRKYNIPFVRFAACGYWPSNYDLYFDNKEEYFFLMDKVVRAAEDARIGLIPSLFWYNATVPDLMDEPRNAWGDKNSRTIEFMRTYTEQVVTRYLDSPAIWGWEFGNEFNLEVDLPNPANYRPVVNINFGTRETRDERDDLTSDMVLVAFEEFAKTVREIDGYRIISNGNANERPSAWNQKYNNTWSQDNEIQHKTMILADNPYPYDVLSTHIYHNIFVGEYLAGNPFDVMSKQMPIRDYVQWLMDLSKELRMPLYIGEWGAPEREGSENAKALFMEKLSAIEDAGVPLSAMWVYNLAGQEGTWNVTGDNHRVYQLEALREANLQIMSEKGKEGVASITIVLTNNVISRDENETEIKISGYNTDSTAVDFDSYEIIYHSDNEIVSIGENGIISINDSGVEIDDVRIWAEIKKDDYNILSNVVVLEIYMLPDPEKSEAIGVDSEILKLIVKDDLGRYISSITKSEISVNIGLGSYSSEMSLDLLIDKGYFSEFTNNFDGTYLLRIPEGESVEVRGVSVRHFNISDEDIFLGYESEDIYSEDMYSEDITGDDGGSIIHVVIIVLFVALSTTGLIVYFIKRRN